MAELPTPIIERLRAAEKLSDHLDPDLIGALLENSLNPADRKRVLQHLAYCSQCREISVLSLPECPDAAPCSKASTWPSWRVVRWGALAACLLLVAAVTLRQRSALRPLPLARSGAAASEPQLPASPPVAATGSPQPLAEKTAPPTHQARASALPAAAVSQEGKAGSGDESEQVMAKANVPTAPTTMLAETVPGRAKELGQESGNAEHAQAVVGLAKAKISSSGLALAQAGMDQKLVPRWTLSADGVLERSFDAGNSWETVPLPSPAKFYVLSAHAMEIWLGGSSGALYHSSDAGARWTRVQPAVNGQVLSEDVIGMEFIDDDHGVLTTATNQQWATEDCGKSWQRK